MPKYIAKPDTWYKAGTEVILEEHMYQDVWLCRGTRVCQNSGAEGGKPVGEEYDDGELCFIDEFEVVE